MTHNDMAEMCAVYAQRIMELEKQLGECSGALEGANNQVAKLRNAAYFGGVYDNYDILIQIEDWLAIMGDLP